jgi:hypothetical protein
MSKGFEEGNYLLRPIPQDRRISQVNLHDYPTAALADRAGIDIVMIGDWSYWDTKIPFRSPWRK